VRTWPEQKHDLLRYVEPGKPVENAYIESLNGKFRDECLNENWFVSLEKAREKIEAWRRDYNQVRPHSTLGYQTREEFAAQAAARGASPPTPLALLTQELISTQELTLWLVQKTGGDQGQATAAFLPFVGIHRQKPFLSVCAPPPIWCLFGVYFYRAPARFCGNGKI
jgi:putative transposase